MTQKRSRSKPRRAAPVSEPCPRPAQSRAAQSDVVATIRDAEPAIVAALIEQAKKNHQAAKFLFEHAGLSHHATPEQDEPSLARVLLERLGLEREPDREREPSGDEGNLRQI